MLTQPRDNLQTFGDEYIWGETHSLNFQLLFHGLKWLSKYMWLLCLFPAVSFVFSPLSCLYSSVSSSLLAQIQLHHHTAPGRLTVEGSKLLLKTLRGEKIDWAAISWRKETTAPTGGHVETAATSVGVFWWQQLWLSPLAWLLRAAYVPTASEHWRLWIRGTRSRANRPWDWVEGLVNLKRGTWWGTSPKVGNNQPNIMGIKGYPPKATPCKE